MVDGDENLLLYLNLTGELFYIVAHRMKSQRVKVEYAKKVFNDLGLAICSPARLQAIISGEISLVTMRFDQVKTLMDQIAHCSIMTVNQYSLEKLFELTMIATKYQFSVCQHPRDILLIILNHLDSLRRVLTDLHAIRLAEDLHNILVITYGRTNVSMMKNYLNSIRNYVQEVRLKMTNLIKLGLQTSEGEFVTIHPPDFWIHPDCVKPGIIEVIKKGRFGQKSKKIHTMFDAYNQSATFRVQHSLAFNGNRIIQLGSSIYDNEGPSIAYDDQLLDGESSGFEELQRLHEHLKAQQQQQTQTNQNQPSNKEDPAAPTEESDFLDVQQAVQGLDLCSQMLGIHQESSERDSHNFTSFTSEHLKKNQGEEGEDGSDKLCDDITSGINIVRIDARDHRFQGRESTLAGLAAIAKQFDVDDFPDEEHQKNLENQGDQNQNQGDQNQTESDDMVDMFS